MVNHLYKTANYVICRFFIALLFLPQAVTAAEQQPNSIVSFAPYTQQIYYKETERQQLYNEEKGTINGAKFTLGYSSENWRSTLTASKGKGTLDYSGSTQLGREIETKTGIKRNIYQLLIARKIYNFENSICQKCGELESFIAGKYIKTKRSIYSKNNITGLNETYSIQVAEFGFSWLLTDIYYFDLTFKLWRSQAIDAKLKVDFLSIYDTNQIDLNAVYANQFELSLTHSFSTFLNVAVLLHYNEIKIEKSDRFTLYSQQESKGTFYQPQRVMQATSLSLQFSFHY